jgi:hypothetical protein
MRRAGRGARGVRPGAEQARQQAGQQRAGGRAGGRRTAVLNTRPSFLALRLKTTPLLAPACAAGTLSAASGASLPWICSAAHACSQLGAPRGPALRIS